jgi:hypothetical protein
MISTVSQQQQQLAHAVFTININMTPPTPSAAPPDRT